VTQLTQEYGGGNTHTHTTQEPNSSQKESVELIQQTQQWALLQMVLKSQLDFLNVWCGGWLLSVTTVVTVLGVVQFSQISHTQA